jgi:O-acetyl-ADP-ribose deacetylase (regulator of RNase III)
VEIILTAVEEPLALAWEEYCGDLPDVTIHRGSILDVPCNAVVSPANSFGFMDGGIDALYMHYFRQVSQSDIQMIVRHAIYRHHAGELVVGDATVVETGDSAIPYLFAAPTMRVPIDLPADTVNPYLAARAVLLLAHQGYFIDGTHAGRPIADFVKRIAFPGTGTGRVRPRVCAQQVRAAILQVRAILDRTHRLPESWLDANAEHKLLYTERSKPTKKGRIW